MKVADKCVNRTDSKFVSKHGCKNVSMYTNRGAGKDSVNHG